MSSRATVYGLLLGCFGAGAVLGALVMQPARDRWSLEAVTSGAVAILGGATIVAGTVHSVLRFSLVMLVAGAGWIVFISLVSALVQGLAPDWARARVLAVFILIFQGGLAAGSAFWGVLATRTSLTIAFIVAGLATIGTTALAVIAKLPDRETDLTPWNHWRMPAIIHAAEAALEGGLVLVTVRYHVGEQQTEPFVQAMEQYGRIRRRDGASWWGIFRDIEQADLFVEAFLVTSWAEHLRQHERFTRADRELEAQIRQHVRGEPLVRHLVDATSE
jgi:MFS family permease